MREQERTIGVLDISIDVICEHCNEMINLLNCDGLTDDGWIYDLVMPKNDHWSGACMDFTKAHIEAFGEPFYCPKCDKELDIGEICY